MVATDIIGFFSSFSVSNYIGAEDMSDRSNFQGNVIVFLVCMLIVSMRQYFMSAIVCYNPSTVGGANAESYLTNLCWTEGTYPLNLSLVVPKTEAGWKKLEPLRISYYQWVPLVLGLQAILYYLPHLLWQVITYGRMGVDLEDLIKVCQDAHEKAPDERKKSVAHIRNTIDVLLRVRREIRENRMQYRYSNLLTMLPGKRAGNSLWYAYLFIKLLYVGVGFVQLIIMHYFLRMNDKDGYFLFGFKLLSDLAHGVGWHSTLMFPRVGMCRQQFEHVGATNYMFAQCALPINMLNEKIYIFLFFYVLFVLIMTILTIPLWIGRMHFRNRKRHFVKRFLKMKSAYDSGDIEVCGLVDRFVVSYLRQDGNFILRMISMNAGDMIAVDVVDELFKGFVKDHKDEDYRGMLNWKNRKSLKKDETFDFQKLRLQKGGSALSKRPDAPKTDSANGSIQKANVYPDAYTGTAI